MRDVTDISLHEGLRLALAELEFPPEAPQFEIQQLSRTEAGVVLVEIRLPSDNVPSQMTLMEALRKISNYEQPRLSSMLEGRPISPAVLAISGIASVDSDDAKEEYYRHIARKHA